MGEQGEARKSNHQQTSAQVSKGAARRSPDESSFWEQGNSGGFAYKPATPANTVFGTSPMIPAILLMVVLLTFFSSPTTRDWLVSASEIPGRAWTSITGGTEKIPASEASTVVWAKKQSGLYYCRGDFLFGKEPGSLMRQDKALTQGYRPANGGYCRDSGHKAAARGESSVARLLGMN